jgi:di/tricarboxylate transporter
MGFDAWLTLAVISLVMGLLAFTRATPYLILFGGLVLLRTMGVIDDAGTLAGFANPGMLTVGILYAVAAGLRETGAMNWAAEPLLGSPRSTRAAQLRVMLPVAGLSAFMNNTPLVAIMLPVVHDWARKHQISISKLMMPLSFASIMGGACTLIGTSTILVVNGLLEQQLGRGLGMFEIAAIGIPAAVAGLLYMVTLGSWLLADRVPAISTTDDPREYVVEMLVPPGSPLAGRTIEDAGLRQLPGLYLIEIERSGQLMAAVSPNVVLQEDDRLMFAGIVESVVDLQRIRGLDPATNQVFKLDAERANRSLVEAVVSEACPIVGMTIREGQFRTRYNAAVIAVARGGERVAQKIGDIVLRAGDTLLLEARASFASQHRNSRDFFLVSLVDDFAPVRHERAGTSLAILGVMVAVVTLGWTSMLHASMLAAGAMVLTRCASARAALRSVDWPVLAVIAAAFGIGGAMQTTGAAAGVTHWLIGLVGDDPRVILAVLTGLTMLFTNVMNANAAAVLMFPIGIEVASSLSGASGVMSPTPFAMGILVGATGSYATPIGYQTNLMVMGPGGYHFSDYVKVGLPLSLLVWALGVLIIPHVWAF